jgi:hypothetical protein
MTAGYLHCLLRKSTPAFGLGEWYFPKSDLELVLAIFSAPAVAGSIFFYFGVFLSVVPYMGFKGVRAIVKAINKANRLIFKGMFKC